MDQTEIEKDGSELVDDEWDEVSPVREQPCEFNEYLKDCIGVFFFNFC